MSVLQDPKQKDYAVRLIHSLSPNAEYQNLLTRLDMKVDKTHFQKFTTKLYEQVNGLSRMSSLQGTVLDEVRRNVTDDEAEKWGGGGSGVRTTRTAIIACRPVPLPLPLPYPQHLTSTPAAAVPTGSR